MSKWNLKELRELIEKVHGPDQLKKAELHINSVEWKLCTASYHSNTSSKAYLLVSDESEFDKFEAIKLIFNPGNKGYCLEDAIMVYEANLLACAHAMHSISDILSHVILDSLNIPHVDENNLTLSSINKILQPGVLKEQVGRFLGLQEYKYLNAFVNTTKHICLVASDYRVDLKSLENPTHGVKFREFEYKKNKLPSKWGEKFRSELKTIAIEYVKTGQQINKSLKNVS